MRQAPIQQTQNLDNSGLLGLLVGKYISNNISNNQQEKFYRDQAKQNSGTQSGLTKLLTSDTLPSAGNEQPQISYAGQQINPASDIKDVSLTSNNQPIDITQNQPVSIADSNSQGFLTKLAQPAQIAPIQKLTDQSPEFVDKNKIASSIKSKAFNQVADMYKSQDFFSTLFGNKGLDEQKNILLKDADVQIDEEYQKQKQQAFNQEVGNIINNASAISDPAKRDQYILSKATKLNNLGYAKIDTNALMNVYRNQYTNIYKHTEPDMSTIVYATDKWGNHTQIAHLTPDGAVLFDQAMQTRKADQTDRQQDLTERGQNIQLELGKESNAIHSRQVDASIAAAQAKAQGNQGMTLSEMIELGKISNNYQKLFGEVRDAYDTQGPAAAKAALNSRDEELKAMIAANPLLAKRYENDVEYIFGKK